MRAALIDQYEGLPRVAEVVQPQPSAGQTLLAVKAATLNPLDLHFASGRHQVKPAQFPYTPGFEGVGHVIQSSVFALGERVRFECRPTFAKGGSFAEYVVVADAWAFPVPENIPDGLAAALGMIGITAWTALEWRAALRQGESVLVLGATSPSGQLAVQAAHLLGASRVVAAGRDPKILARLREIGADATVELGTEHSVEALAQAFQDAMAGRVDIVIDALWGTSVVAALYAAAPAARIVNFGGAASEMAELPSGPIRSKGLTLLGHHSMLPPREIVAASYRRVVEHAARGEMTVACEEIPLDQVSDAWQRQRSSLHQKLVLIP
jgi:NADPH2:quinone reductase